MDCINLLNTDLTIKPKGLPNRINSEINNLFNQSNFVSSERKKDSISIRIVRDGNKYDMDLPVDYPFKIPTNILVNGVDYKKSLLTSSVNIKAHLKKNYNIDCLCCNNILCSEWVPSNNISRIINEIISMAKIKKDMKLRLLCDEVRHKGKCYFAEFEKYLFISSSKL
jgi:hypothetical protein